MNPSESHQNSDQNTSEGFVQVTTQNTLSNNSFLDRLQGKFSDLKYSFKSIRFFGMISITFLVMSLGVGVLAVQQRQDIRQEAFTYSANLQLPSSDTIQVGEDIYVPVMLLTSNSPVDQVSIAIGFDPSYLSLESVDTRPYQGVLDVYHPLVDGKFDESGVVVTANNSGVARFKISSSQKNSFTGVRGVHDPLALLHFKATQKTLTPTIIKYVTQNGASMVVSSETGENILVETSEMEVTIQ